MFNATKQKKVIVNHIEAISALLKNDAFIFSSDFGKKGIDTLTTAQRIRNQLSNPKELKEFNNYNIFTGFGNIGDVDLDCPEALQLADYFLPATGFEFGRESTPRSHRLVKIIDLTKKHTRKYFDFKKDAKKAKGAMLVELRAHKFYTMCHGQYDNGEKPVWNKADELAEVTYDALFKSVALLAAATVVLKKFAPEGMRNEYWKLMIASFWYAHIDEADTIKIVEAVTATAGDNTKERLARVTDIYKRDKKEELQGLPTLATQFNWTDSEAADFKKILLAITGRHTLPKNAGKLIEQICFLMKQNKYWDFEDQELYEERPVNVKYGKDFKSYTATKAFIAHPDRKVCKDFRYQPSKKPERYVKIKKSLYVNTYSPNDLIPNPKTDTDLFWALVKHVMPHEQYCNHFLDWFAFPMQNPGIKIRHAIIFQSDQLQLGKGSLFDMQRDILGHHNTSKIDLAQALNRERGYLVDKQTVLIDEAKASGRWSEKSMLVNTLKILISEYTAGTRELYKGYAEKDTCTNYWINTNFRDAFPLEPNDPRYFVYFSPAKRNERLLKEYHEERKYGDLVAGVYAEMLDRDLSKFNPEGVAPDSPFKDEMVRKADRPIRDRIREKFEQGVFPFDRDLVTTVELFGYFQNIARIKVSRENEIAEGLQLVGGVRVRSCPVTGVGRLCNIWVIRRHHAYKDKTAKELGKNYKPFWNVEQNILKAK